MAALATFAVLAVGLAACGGDDDAGAAGDGTCSPVERLVEPTQGHVLPGATVSYRHHPPTSGRHLAELPARGVHTEPIAEERQVYALEGGFVLLQYGPGLAAEDRAALEAYAQDEVFVIVAPAVSIDSDRAVALTAWERRQLCDAVEPSAIDAFLADHAGRGPGND
jgi:hypothetical protein